MKTMEKLALLKEMEARNAEREREIMDKLDRDIANALDEYDRVQKRFDCLKNAEVHRTIEIYAGAILESLETLARFHGLNRADLLELLVATAWALEQIKEQED